MNDASINLNDISIKWRLITHSEQLLLTIPLFRLSLTDVLPPFVERSISNPQRQYRNNPCYQDSKAETVPKPVFGRLLLQKDVGANGTSETADTDDQCLQ